MFKLMDKKKTKQFLAEKIAHLELWNNIFPIQGTTPTTKGINMHTLIYMFPYVKGLQVRVRN